MSYTILSVAYPFTPVGPNATGGSEQILTSLDREMTLGGHRSLVIAVEGSHVQGELIPSPACPGGLDASSRNWGQRAHHRLLLETLDRYPVDLVHMHALDFHAYVPPPCTPTLATLHLPVDWYPNQIFLSPSENVFLNCVSASQQTTCPACVKLLPFVPNGIDVESFHWMGPRGDFVLALGRICPEKGFHLALDAARQAGVSMVLAGEIFPYSDHTSYFETQIAPRLDEQRRFIGPASASMKRQLLSEAAALLVPSLVAETCSLVTMEALASGTPVIAFPAGAIPELVEDGRTGFLVEDRHHMARAIKKLPLLRGQDCRRAAEERCGYTRMVQSYLALYGRILDAPPSQTRPQVNAGLFSDVNVT